MTSGSQKRHVSRARSHLQPFWRWTYRLACTVNTAARLANLRPPATQLSTNQRHPLSDDRFDGNTILRVPAQDIVLAQQHTDEFDSRKSEIYGRDGSMDDAVHDRQSPMQLGRHSVGRDARVRAHDGPMIVYASNGV